MVKKTKEAFTWIINILRKHKISFQISGGFAANIYGSNRPLADIDIEVPDEEIFKIQNIVKKYIIYGPKKYKDKEFDLLLMTLKYKGQEIDICGINSQKLFNKQRKKWTQEKNDLSKATKKKIYNHIVPVISLKDLISYKKKISREVDLQDLKKLTK
ncbi:MAG: hypothetical protein ABIC91_03420 [Nanoarchaeota archaeon]|nr:hypothetical protein [Nanoarchaeota archaeon]MBU1030025.1 hypothetical protein [Nanoarchaeota archaeon]MBU1849965.1 hypothetical protein [Nanoarchaeota archaeon]